MTTANEGTISRKMKWAGYVMTAVPALLLVVSSIMKLMKPASVIEGFAHLGYEEDVALGLGIVELSCTALYLLPRTSVLGAILLTGYLGGATATHLRIGEPYYTAIALGVLLWGGLYLRDERLRLLIPFR